MTKLKMLKQRYEDRANFPVLFTKQTNHLDRDVIANIVLVRVKPPTRSFHEVLQMQFMIDGLKVIIEISLLDKIIAVFLDAEKHDAVKKLEEQMNIIDTATYEAQEQTIH